MELSVSNWINHHRNAFISIDGSHCPGHWPYEPSGPVMLSLTLIIKRRGYRTGTRRCTSNAADAQAQRLIQFREKGEKETHIRAAPGCFPSSKRLETLSITDLGLVLCES
nr:hypothetical protein HmN_000508700 [Hymenolepis microstoma]